MEGGVEWPCRHCGGRFTDLSAHYPECGAKRLAQARGDLRRLEGFEAEYRPPRDLPMPKVEFQVPALPSQIPAAARPKGKGGRPRQHPDRKAYMRDYMRRRRVK